MSLPIRPAGRNRQFNPLQFGISADEYLLRGYVHILGPWTPVMSPLRLACNCLAPTTARYSGAWRSL